MAHKESKVNTEEESEDSSGETAKKEQLGKKRFKIPDKNDFLAFKDRIRENIRKCILFAQTNFKPQLLTSIFTAAGIFISIGCSAWQLTAYHDTEILIEKINRNSSKPVEEIPPAAMLADKEQYDYRPVTVSGEMMFLNSINLMDRKFEGKHGYHILTPIRTDSGEVVLVDRGWVEKGKSPNNTYWKTTDITVKGYARVPEPKGRFTQVNNVKKNEWYWPDLDAIAKYAGVLKLHPLIIEQEKISTAENEYPIGGQTVINITNHHRKIAIFLFVLSVVFLITWVTDSFKNGIFINSSSSDAENKNSDENAEDEDGAPKKSNKPADEDDTPPPAKPKGK